MTKEIYIGQFSGHINQYLANLVIGKQLLVWDKNNYYNYKTMYLALKTWPFLEFQEFFIL